MKWLKISELFKVFVYKTISSAIVQLMIIKKIKLDTNAGSKRKMKYKNCVFIVDKSVELANPNLYKIWLFGPDLQVWILSLTFGRKRPQV